MSGDEIKAAFSALPDHAKTKFLSHLSSAMTIAARNCYPDSASELEAARAFRQLKGLNEAQHRVASALWSAIEGHYESIADGWFVDAAMGWAATGGCASQMEAALAQAMSLTERELGVVGAAK